MSACNPRCRHGAGNGVMLELRCARGLVLCRHWLRSRGITGLLSERVGSTGRVVGLDMNARFRNMPCRGGFKRRVLLGDAYGSNLPAGAFDLVHMRFVASTSEAPERLLQEAKRSAAGRHDRSAGSRYRTLNCYPSHPSWDKLKAALFGAFSAVGADVELARRRFHRSASGLVDSIFDHSSLVCGQWIHWSTIYRRLLSPYAMRLELGFLSELSCRYYWPSVASIWDKLTQCSRRRRWPRSVGKKPKAKAAL